MRDRGAAAMDGIDGAAECIAVLMPHRHARAGKVFVSEA